VVADGQAVVFGLPVLAEETVQFGLQFTTAQCDPIAAVGSG
jgi:hypothetical protein